MILVSFSGDDDSGAAAHTSAGTFDCSSDDGALRILNTPKTNHHKSNVRTEF